MAIARIDAVATDAHARVSEVVVRHERTLLRIARQASLCHDDALDAYQRALEIFVRRVETVDPATEVAWLKVVVRHEAMAIRRARMDSVAGDDLDLDSFVPAVERSVEDKLASEERVRRSAEALRALKPDEAKALMMKAHGLSYAEIGAQNGWSYTKVNRAVTEGRRRFISAYEGIESGAECERFEPIVQALGAGSGDNDAGPRRSARTSVTAPPAAQRSANCTCRGCAAHPCSGRSSSWRSRSAAWGPSSTSSPRSSIAPKRPTSLPAPASRAPAAAGESPPSAQCWPLPRRRERRDRLRRHRRRPGPRRRQAGPRGSEATTRHAARSAHARRHPRTASRRS